MQFNIPIGPVLDSGSVNELIAERRRNEQEYNAVRLATAYAQYMREQRLAQRDADMANVQMALPPDIDKSQYDASYHQDATGRWTTTLTPKKPDVVVPLTPSGGGVYGFNKRTGNLSELLAPKAPAEKPYFHFTNQQTGDVVAVFPSGTRVVGNAGIKPLPEIKPTPTLEDKANEALVMGVARGNTDATDMAVRLYGTDNLTDILGKIRASKPSTVTAPVVGPDNRIYPANLSVAGATAPSAMASPSGGQVFRPTVNGYEQGGPKSYKSEADVLAAVANGEIRVGDVFVVNGRKARWSN